MQIISRQYSFHVNFMFTIKHSLRLEKNLRTPKIRRIKSLNLHVTNNNYTVETCF